MVSHPPAPVGSGKFWHEGSSLLTALEMHQVGQLVQGKI